MLARMLSFVKRILGARQGPGPAEEALPTVAPADPRVRSGDGFLDLLEEAGHRDGFHHPRWERVEAWLEGLPESARNDAWLACERTWLELFRESLGGNYRLHESATCFLLSAQSPRTAAATLGFLDTTLRRVQHLLEELAASSDAGKEILVVFADEEDYYRYVGYYYPDEGEFAMSSGMFLHAGCSHFVVHGEELSHFEPVIVHEMTHSQLSHLPIPAWLNEGMAVNSEQRLTRIGADAWSVMKLEDQHRKFWTVETIQQFWSGAAFLRPDQGSELAYDLGRLMVNGLSSDWAAFKRFAQAAHLEDAGRSAAHAALDIDLGEFVRHFLRQTGGEWGPVPSLWPAPPERGQFRGSTHAP
ncbi:hypothetical protein [Arenimonas sp. MALMAid1274]|uniref:hypothetical protein n=1 Tax=Arenimonas sp. MALMAid1274 TaxID=3411630 RepID=UPI003BA35C64